MKVAVKDGNICKRMVTRKRLEILVEAEVVDETNSVRGAHFVKGQRMDLGAPSHAWSSTLKGGKIRDLYIVDSQIRENSGLVVR